LRLKDISWDQALDIIMQTKGLDMRKNGNVVLIAPREELALKEKQQLENQLQISQLEPLVMESFQLNYIKAADLERIISSNRQQRFGAGAGQTATTGGQGSIISERGVAFVDPRTNILFVSDTASRLEEVRKIIRQLDTPIRQVMIEARIVIASDTFSRQLGVRFGAQTGFTFNKYAVGQGGSLDTQPVVHLQGDKLTRDTGRRRRSSLPRALHRRVLDSPQLNVNLPVINPAGQLALTLINLGSGNLINLELSALEADGRGKVVSSPRVVTVDNGRQRSSRARKSVVTPGTQNAPATVTYRKAVLRLDVTRNHAGQPNPHGRRGRRHAGAPFPLGRHSGIPIDTKNVITQPRQ
jgi:type IV pilus assembly protein PilQ